MYNKRSTAEEVTEGLDLTGLTFLVTGVNSGLGFETLRVLTKRGAHVLAAARTLEKARAACDQIDGETTPLACELSDLASVKACAEQVLEMDIPLDRLICNAGIMALPELQVKDGLEMQFLTNHMGHFLLVYLLQPALIRAHEARVVFLSSAAHMYTTKTGINFNNLDGKDGYNAWQFYGQSKLANLLTAMAFDERLSDTGVRVNAVHPGVIKTNLGRDLDGVLGLFMSLPFVGKIMEWTGGKSITQGAATQCYVACSKELKGVGGKYFADCKVNLPSRHGRSEALAEKLWQFSLDYLEPFIESAPAKEAHTLTDLTESI